MPAPTFIASYTVANYGVSGSPKTTSVTTQAGDVIVVYAADENGAGNAFGTPSGNGITFTLRQSIRIDNNWSDTSIWSGTDTAGGTNWTLSLTGPTSSYAWGFTCLVFRNSTGVGASNKTNVSGGVPSLSLTTTQPNSSVVVLSADWNAGDGTSRTWNTVNGITPSSGNGMETTYFYTLNKYTVYGAYYSDVGSAGTSSYGLSAPSGQKYSIVALEVLGSSSSGLISEYSFNENTGTTAGDSSGNGYTITVDSTKWTSAGHTSNAIAGPTITATNVAIGPASLPARTVMCWAKMPTVWPNNAMTVVAAINPNFEALYIGGATAGPNNIGRYDQTNTIDVSGTINLSLNTWYHLAWVTGSNGLKMYVNAVLDGSNATTVSYGLASTRLATGDTGSTLNFTGIIDELRVFNTQLSAAQITTWMNTPIDIMSPLMWVA